MQGYNCIMVYDKDRKNILFCKRLKDPYKGLYNLVGGKIENGENGFLAAYRELEEETGITKKEITLKHMMDFTYYNQECYVEVYVGTLNKIVDLVEEKHPLEWISIHEDFFSRKKFAGEGNIGHMIEQVVQYGEGKVYNDNNPYYDGAKIPFGNEVLIVEIIKSGSTNQIKIQGKRDENGQMRLILTTYSENTEDYRKAANKFFRLYAKQMLWEKTSGFAIKMGVRVNRITIKEQKTRWGSCSSKGNINYHWKLVLMPEEISDYIVVHELAHLKQMNHSPEFWKVVESIIPDYKTRRDWLRKSGKDYQIY